MSLNLRQIEDTIAESLLGLGWSATTVSPSCHFSNDLGIDSIEVVELAAVVWKRCGLPPRTLEVRQIETVAELAARLATLAGTGVEGAAS